MLRSGGRDACDFFRYLRRCSGYTLNGTSQFGLFATGQYPIGVRMPDFMHRQSWYLRGRRLIVNDVRLACFRSECFDTLTLRLCQFR
jgi:hypothetical protein